MGFHKKRANNVKTFTNHLLEFFELPYNIINPGFMIKPLAKLKKLAHRPNKQTIGPILWVSCGIPVYPKFPSCCHHGDAIPPLLPAPWFSREFGDMRRPKSNSGWYVAGRPASRHRKAPSLIEFVFEDSFRPDHKFELLIIPKLEALWHFGILTSNMDRTNKHSPTGKMF